jgi:hypothetical protein
MSTFGDALYQYGGVPVGVNFLTQGNTYFVKPYSGNDGNDGKSPNSAFKTLVHAQLMATANQNDVVYMCAESNTASATTDYQSAALDWAKDGVHLIGIGAGPMIGQRSRIAELSTVKTIEDLFTVSADNCLIANIEVFQGVASSTATAARAVVVSGMRNRFVNCQMSGNGDTGGSTDDAGARSLAVTGAENLFQHCYIGLDTVIRATQTTEVSIGAVARTIFEDCMFNSYTSLSTFKAVTMTSIDRFVFFRNCVFNAVQNITSAVAPTGAIINTTPNGSALILGGGVFGYADVSTLADTKTLMLANWGLSTAANFPGIAQGLAPS